MALPSTDTTVGPAHAVSHERHGCSTRCVLSHGSQGSSCLPLFQDRVVSSSFFLSLGGSRSLLELHAFRGLYIAMCCLCITKTFNTPSFIVSV